MAVKFTILLLLSLLFFISDPLNAQDTPKLIENKEAPVEKIGLALSGGGAKGFVHIGVLRVLEEVGMPIDFISGTSMGALVGGLYSIGYTSDDLEKLALEIDWNDLFSDTIRRRHIPIEEKRYDGLFMLSLPILDGAISLPSGVVAGQRISMLLKQLTWPYRGEQDFSKLPIPFVCVATDIETGEKVVLKEGQIADAIRASISIPSALMPHRIGDRLLVDGGVVRNLPVEEVIDYGADFVIAVDVVAPLKKAEDLRSIVDILDQTITFQIKESVIESRKKANLVIQSDTAKTFSVADFDKAIELIELGEIAAREFYDELKELADYLNAKRETLPIRDTELDFDEPVKIRKVEVNGNESISNQQIINRLMISPDTLISSSGITDAVERLYGSMFFENVLYRLTRIDDSNNYNLEIELNEKVQDQFQFGFNYNNIDNASLLFNLSLRNYGFANSVTRASLKLSDEPYAEINYFQHLNLENYLGMNLRAVYNLQKVDLFSPGGNRLAQYTTHSLVFESLFLPLTGRQIKSGVGLRQEFFNVSRRVGEFDFPAGTSTITQFLAMFKQDNLDRLHFPRRGHQIYMEAAQSVNFLDNSLNFFKAQAKWQGNFQINSNLVMLAGAKVGVATRSELPLHHQFFLGGYPEMAGFRRYEIGSSSIRYLSAGSRYEFMSNNFAEVRLNAASEDGLMGTDFFDNPVRFGWSLGYGLKTLIGPLKANIMGSTRNPVMIYVTFGSSF